MTLVSFTNTAQDSAAEAKVGVPSLSFLNLGSRRISLRKRSYDHNEEDNMNLSSYNSAFLDGLFSDVAKLTENTDDLLDDEENQAPLLPASSTLEEDAAEEECRLDHSLSVKRSRVSLTKSVSRCGRSFMNLSEVISPGGVADFFAATTSAFTANHKGLFEPSCSPSMERMDSLHEQLNSIDPSPSPKSVKSVLDIIDMAFPNLPATISDSSCSRPSVVAKRDLTRTSDQPESDAETSPNTSACTNNDYDDETKESYGWFVQLDDDEDDETSNDQDSSAKDPYARTSSSTDLAFTAPTAPKRASNYDAEVEWAKAADTVDDVLGDFF